MVYPLQNMNRAHQGINKEKLTKLILNTLRLRDHLNKKQKGGRNYKKLSPGAKSAIEKSKLGRSFWLRFNARHPELRLKRQGQVSLRRALNCTRDMACEHIGKFNIF